MEATIPEGGPKRILVSYRGIPQSPGWATGDMVTRAFRAMGHMAFPYGNYYQTSRWIEPVDGAFDREWDLLLFMECGDGDRTYTELRSVRALKRASWFFDAALHPEKWLDIVRLFDFDANFVANRGMADQAPRCQHLPYAADRVLHYRPPSHPKQRFLALAGSDRPERRAVAEVLSFTGVQLQTGLFREAFIDHLASSFFTISDIAGGGAGLVPMRPFEALAAGSALITPADDGVRSLGLPCIEYRTREHLAFICRRLLECQDRPDPAGQDLVMKCHSYECRCEAILRQVFPDQTDQLNQQTNRLQQSARVGAGPSSPPGANFR